MKEKTKKKISKVFLYSLSIVCIGWFFFISDINPVLSLWLLFIFTYFKIKNFKKPQKINFLHLILLFVLGFSLIILFKRYHLSPYLIPLPSLSMLTVILFPDLELAMLICASLSIFAGFIFNANIYIMLVMFLGSLAGGFSVYNARQRYKILNAGILTSVIMVLALVVVSYKQKINISFLSSLDILPAFINGVLSAFIVAGALPIFEHIFNTATNISLLELADFNQPILRRLILEAPGTYHHSLLVGNLSEMAAEAIDANSLLARIGSYYHDIGKLDKPEYFSENQERSLSVHTQLKASISKLVIVKHVKNGIDLAKEYRLTQTIIDFIEQHHGTSLVFYFYRKALQETKKKDEVKEEVFRYNGPKPQTKETAIVLLADSVEAACRAQEAYNVQKIEETVHTVINNKFIDGQLDECDLTLKDLNKIAKTFIRILSVIYHSRVEYQEIKSESINKEPSKKS